MLILNVPYNEKDEAKALGAKWNPNIKKWYVENSSDYHKFIKWILPQGDIIACDAIYVVEGRQNCFKCGKETKVIGIALKSFIEIWDDDSYDDDLYEEDDSHEDGFRIDYNDDFITLVGPIDPVPDYILKSLQKKYNYKEKYSNTTKESHVNNCCEHCDVLQGDYFLFSEVDSPFFLDSEEKLENLKIYRLPLKEDIIIKTFCEVYQGEEAIVFSEYALEHMEDWEEK